MGQPTAPAAGNERPGVKERNRRRIVGVAREVVAAEGVETLSMRTLAEAAGVSVTTLYNLFGTKEAIVRALAVDVLETFDGWVRDVDEPDSIERVRAQLAGLIDLVLERAPRSLVGAVLDDEHLVTELNAGWRSRDVIEASIGAAIDSGALVDTLAPAALAEHVRTAYVRLQRMWAAGVIDGLAFRAGALYALDLTLAAVATEPVRRAVLDHAATLEPALPASAGA
jgi:AcrR family transcriptional regulator